MLKLMLSLSVLTSLSACAGFAAWEYKGDEPPVILRCMPRVVGAEYLEGGKLKERIAVILSRTGGFAGDSFSYYIIEKDGSWTSGFGVGMPLGHRQETGRGQLTDGQIAELARQFARFELSALPETHGIPRIGSSAIEIRMGTRSVILHGEAGKTSKEADRIIRIRFDGVVEAIRTVCQEPVGCVLPVRDSAIERVREIDMNGVSLPGFASGFPKLITISSGGDLAQVIANQDVRGRISKQIDFENEELLLFRWTGSNTDRLGFAMEATSQGTTAVFSFSKGQGEDFPHPRCRLFIVAKNSWRFAQ